MLKVRLSALCFVLAVTPLWAQLGPGQKSYEVGIDADSNPATGCEYVMVDGTVVPGVDWIYTILVQGNTNPPTVLSATRTRCTIIDGAEAFVAEDGPRAGLQGALGLNTGLDGGDFLEGNFTIGVLTETSQMQAVFQTQSAEGGWDVINTPMTFNFGTTIPTLQTWALLAFLTLMLFAALWLMRRNRRIGRGGLIASIFFISLVVIAATCFTIDGDASDWDGLTPFATDPQGDANNDDPTVDLLGVYIGFCDEIYFRFDVDDIENVPPVATADAYTLDEGATLNVDAANGVLANDTDANPQDTLTAQEVSGPTNGSLTLNADGSFEYTHDGSETTTDDFTYEAFDGTAASNVVTVSLTITPVNDAPVADAQTVNTDEDTPLDITLTGSDDENDALTFTVQDQPAKGDLSGTAPNLTYTPELNYNGPDSFTFIANDGTDDSAPVTVDITVGPVEDTPVADDQTVDTDEDTPLVITLAGDDVEVQDLTFEIVDQPDNGSLGAITRADTAFVTYTPDEDFNGSDSFTFTTSDGILTSLPGTIDITINAVNDAPEADLNGVAAGVDFTRTFTEGAGATSIVDAAATVIDVDDTNLESGVITLTNLLDAGLETLAVNTAGTSIVAGYDGGTGVLTLTGSDTVENYQAVVRSLTYDNTSADPDDTNRSITVVVDDGELDSATATITLGIIGINSEPSFTAGADQTVLEDEGGQNAAAWATGIDDGDGGMQNLTFGIVTSNDALFDVLPAIDSVTGDLTYTTAADANGSATITVTLSDDGGVMNGGDDTTPSVDFTITVTAVNDAPSFTVGADESILEDAGAQTVPGFLTNISAGPADEAAQTVSFNVGNDNNALFDAQPTIDGSGQLTYTPAMGATGSAIVTVSAMDNGGTADGGADTSADQTFNISVNGVNDAPSFTAGADETVLEDAGAQSVNGWATNIDDGDDGSQMLTFNITNNTNAALFAAGPAVDASGNLTYTPADDANGSATITIELMDDGGTADGGADTSASTTFDITVTAVNDAPSFTVGADQNILEDAGAQTVPGFLTDISEGPSDESTQSLSFNVSNDDNALFDVQPAIDASGELTYTPAMGATGSAIVTVSAMDDGGTADGGADTSADQTFNISIGGVNDAPSFTVGADETVLEDAGAQTVNGWATNIDDGDDGSQVLTFNITNNTNAALFAAAPAVDSSGNLTYTPADDANGSATITIELMDDGGTADGGNDTSASTTFDINVTAVNDVPSFTVGADQTELEDAGAQTVNGFIADGDAGPTDESGQTLSYNVSNDDNALFSVQPAIDASGNLTYTPDADANGTATVTVTIMDDGGTADGGVDTSAGQTFDITLTPVNDVPEFTKGADVNYVGTATPQTEAAWATDISDGDDGSQMLTFNVTNNTNAAIFAAGPAVDPTTGNLTYTPVNGADGTATITIELMDDGGTANGGVDTSAAQTFDITLTAPNAEPSFTVGADENVLEDAGAQSVNGWATNIDDGDGGSQTLTFNITGNTNAGLFAAGPAVDSSGNLTYTPAADANGSATITIELMDNGGTANGGDDTSASAMFDINVTAVNDEPSFSIAGNQAVDENLGAQSVNGFATPDAGGGADESGQTFTYSVVNDNNALFSVQPAIDASGNLTYTSQTNASGSTTVTVSVTDNGGTANGGDDTSPDQMFTITINDVPDPPMANDESYTVFGNTELVASDDGGDTASAAGRIFLADTTDLRTNATDADTAVTSLTASVVAAPTNGTLDLEMDGSFTYVPDLGFDGMDSFTYTLNDGTSNSNTATVTLNVTTDQIWFVNNETNADDAGAQNPVDNASGDEGSSIDPFDSLTALETAATGPAAGDIIYLFEGDSDYETDADGLGLLNTQTLIGAAADLIVSANTLRAGVGANRPTVINNNDANVITLGDGNTIEGLNIDANGNTVMRGMPPVRIAGVNGNGVTGGTLTDVTIAVSNDADGIILEDVDGTFSFDGSIAGPAFGSAIFITGDGTSSPVLNLTNSAAAAGTIISDIGIPIEVSGDPAQITLTDDSIDSTTGGTSITINVNGDGGFLNFSGAAGINVSGVGFGLPGVFIDAFGFDFDSSLPSTGSITADTSVGGGPAIVLSGLGTGSVINWQGPVTVNGAVNDGIAIDSAAAETPSVTIADLSVSGAADAGILIANGSPDIDITLDGTNGLANTAGTAIEIAGLDGGTVDIGGGGVSDSGDGILIQNLTNAPVINFTNEVDTTGLSGSNSSGASATFANLDVTASTIDAINIDNFNGFTITTGTVGATNTNGVLLSNIATTLSVNLTSVTVNNANNGAGTGINLDTVPAAGALTIDALSVTTNGNPGVSANSGTLNVDTDNSTSTSINTTDGVGLNLSGATVNLVFDTIGVNHSAGGGISLMNLTGTTNLGDVDIINTGATGLFASNAGTVNSSAGSTINTTNAPAIDLNTLTSGLNFDTVTSLNSSGIGVELDAVSGAFTINDGNAGSSNDLDVDGAVNAGLDIATSSATVSINSATIDGSGGAGVALTNNGGSVTISGGAIGANTNNTGNAVDVDQGSATVAIGASITNTTSRAVEITNRTGGTATISGAVDGDGTGILLNSNTGATINLTGGMALDTGNNTAFTATGGGTVNVTGVNTIGANTTLNAQAVNINNTTIGTSGVTFRSIAVNGGVNATQVGISLNTTGNSGGGFTVTGDGSTAGSGGTIASTVNRGAEFISANDIMLSYMTFTNAATSNGADPTTATTNCGSLDSALGSNVDCAAPIHAQSASGVTLDNLAITNSVQVGINLRTVTDFVLSNSTMTGIGNQTREYGIKAFDVFGTCAITSTSISGSNDDNVRIRNEAATALTMTVTNSTFNNSPSVSGFQIQSQSNADMTFDFTGSTFSGNFADGISAFAEDSADLDIDVTTGVFSNNSGNHVNIAVGDSATAVFNITNNGTAMAPMLDAGLSGINVNMGSGSSAGQRITGTISGNFIGLAGDANSGAGTESGIRYRGNGNGTATLDISNNTIREVQFGDGISALCRDGGNTNHFTVRNNNINLTSVNAFDGIYIQSGVSTTDTTTVCADIRGNTTASAGGDGIFVRQRRANTIFQLERLGANSAADGPVETHIGNENPGSTGVNATIEVQFTAVADDACPDPTD